MAIELPDPQAKTRIVSETLALCQCCHLTAFAHRADGGRRTTGAPG
ncbi:hypothetical protein [Rhodanobacter glycinis]|nr:hypothetical protein [Rhodanobacter glycinis]